MPGNVQIRASGHAVVAEPQRAISPAAECEWYVVRVQYRDLPALELDHESVRLPLPIRHRHIVIASADTGNSG